MWIKKRANTNESFFSKILSPFKPSPKSAPEAATIGWKPPLIRMSSVTTGRHVRGEVTKPAATPTPVPRLKRQLTWGTKNDNERQSIRVEVVEVTSTGATSGSSTDSCQRVFFESKLLRPADTSKAGSKIRQRVPSPFPDAQPRLPLSKDGKDSRPPVRTRTSSQERRQEYYIYDLDGYFDANPTITLPPGWTPYRGHCNHGSVHTTYWDPEARDADSEANDADSETSDADSEASDTESDCRDLRWETDTAYSDDDDLLYPCPPRHPDTPAAPLPPLVLKSVSSPLPDASQHSDTEDSGIEPFPDLPTTQDSLSASPVFSLDPDAWLPTDPSANYVSLQIDERVPRLAWVSEVGADRQPYTRTLRPPRGVTGGISNGRGGPSHTPAPECVFTCDDPRLLPVDARELDLRLCHLKAERDGEDSVLPPSYTDSLHIHPYDLDMERIRARHQTPIVDKSTEQSKESNSAQRPAAPADALASLRLDVDNENTLDSLLLRDDNAPAGRWPKTGCPPKSNAHNNRRRAATQGQGFNTWRAGSTPALSGLTPCRGRRAVTGQLAMMARV